MLDRKRIGWFILLRVVVITVFLASTLFVDLSGQDAGVITPAGFLRLALATYLFSLCSLLVLWCTDKLLRTVTYAQIVWDLILVTVLVLLTGGVNSPYAFLYFLSIVSASVFLSRSEALYTASLCVILNGAILDLQYYGKLASIGISQIPAQQYGAGYLLYLIFLYGTAFYLTAFLAGSLSERARRSETALKEKAIDFEELERLNNTIVSTMDSGLITITGEGRIRVFNPFAELLTGISHPQAYDRPLAEVIPGIAPFAHLLFAASSGEFEHHSAGGEQFILSFKSVPLCGKDGDGAIIDLHDLTGMKRMEALLKRSDRLAAVGELSARMAHEIRNPLAAISGSVQLVTLREWADDKDKRLFSIILRETDRLDGLLREFLAYARPSPPQQVALPLRQMVTELCALSSRDPRLQMVTVVNRVPEGLSVRVDRDQFKQVLWNLFMNAAEAITGAGDILVEAQPLSDADGEAGVEITVSDSGCGMDEAQARRVFEPFFTTKSGGTGLGLATVYRIVQAHQGQIEVETAPGSGTTVTIFLPA